MTDKTKTPTFLDDELELDLDLFGDDDPADTQVRGGSRVRKQKSYSPARMRTNANWQRIGVAAFVAIALVLILGFAVKAVLDTRKENAYRDYMTKDVKQIADRSANQGADLQDLLAQPSGTDRTQLISRIEKLKGDANAMVKEAKEIDTPEAMQPAHESFVLSLQYRANGFDALQKSMTAALQTADKQKAAVAVADAMRRFIASDVIFTDSYFAQAVNVLTQEKLDGITVIKSAFVTDGEFDSVRNVKAMLDRLSVPPAKGAKGAKAKPKPTDGKTHGMGLHSVKAAPSGIVLTPGQLNEVPSSAEFEFQVLVQNQGQGQEVQIPVTITMKSDQSAPQVLKGTLERIDPGGEMFVNVALKEQPKFGETLNVTVEVEPVPGEKDPRNNSTSFTLLFKQA